MADSGGTVNIEILQGNLQFSYVLLVQANGRKGPPGGYLWEYELLEAYRRVDTY